MFEKIHEIGTRAWLRLLQGINAILIAGAGIALTINEAYPGTLANAVNKLPPLVGIPLIVAVGALIHYAARRAKVSPND